MSNLLIENNIFETSDEGIGLGEGVEIKNIIGNHFSGEGVHIKDYRTAPEMTYIDTLLNENTFGTTVIVQDHEGNIELATIFSSIQAAINEASGGDIIEVASGSYEEVITVDVENITLRSAERHGAVINGTVTIKADNVTVDGFTIRDSEAPVLIEFHGTDGTSILNNRAEASLNSQAKLAAGNWYGASVGDSSIKNNEFVGAVGLYPKDGAVIEIVNNTVNGAYHEGIWLVPDADVVLTIEDNTITDHDLAGDNLSEIKVVSRPASINDETTSGEMKESLLIENSVDSVYLQWATVKDGQSIQDAIDAALEGDTIEVHPGTYTESLSVNKDSLILKSLEKHEAKVDRIRIQADNVRIDGFYLQGDGTLRGAIDETGSRTGYTIENNLIRDHITGIFINDGSDGVIDNNVIDNVVAGIALSSGTSSHTVINNIITNASDECIGIAGPDNNIEKNELRDSSAGIKIFKGTWSLENTIITDNVFCSSNNYAISNEALELIDARYNWWGHPSGPSGAGQGSGAAVSDNVDYRPWLLEAGGERFDFTLVLGQGWNVVSAPSNIEQYEIKGDVAAWLAHTASGWVSDESVISKEFKNPAGAVFVNANETLGVGYIWADFGPGDDFANKQLREGWNLIGVGNTDDSMNRLSNLKYESGEGITSIYSPNVFNQVKDVSYHWQISQMDKTSWKNEDKMYRLDGYWVYLRGSDRVHSVTVEPAGSASDLVSEAI
ncbi:hypothetical protein Mzhil_1804 [Methanosalsum zhilinae DSM 4017]|uniref:Carbohydrate-binding/sugar hydrolysis domain-containing protein n=1 Tax=Methanosalsum zhilinae (strain DSM 4017 / NBRC 107636 / OCM 62 / WeN5) TaxID=679901 RepID=F7XQP0_METZD|nr:right-handed parallel beta-helix repeat-containing protein [Methanosalsum zhilinae]AEH61639.1 hypothetical protein Mzhil_1804 [Methanosalsum zhilinae DSM 4017]